MTHKPQTEIAARLLLGLPAEPDDKDQAMPNNKTQEVPKTGDLIKKFVIAVKVMCGIFFAIFVFYPLSRGTVFIVKIACALGLGMIGINVSESAESLRNVEAAAEILGLIVGIMAAHRSYKWVVGTTTENREEENILDQNMPDNNNLTDKPVMPQSRSNNQFIEFIKWLFKWIIITPIIIGCLAGGGYAVYNYISYEIPKSKIEITVSAKDNRCSAADYPIFVNITNGSDKTVTNISFDIAANIFGHSTDIADYNNYSSDLIMKPGEVAESCWKVKLKDGYENQVLKDLGYEIKYKQVTFRE